MVTIFSEDIELHTDLILLIGLTGLMLGYFWQIKHKEISMFL